MRNSHLNPYQAYQKASTTLDSGVQLVMLYDGAIKYMQHALAAIEAKKYSDSFQFIDTACAIMHGLAASLDFSANKAIAEALDEYYHSLDIRMVLFEHNHDMEMYDQIIDDLKTIRNSWNDIITNKLEKGNN